MTALIEQRATNPYLYDIASLTSSSAASANSSSDASP
jgi:hypothetical protein